MLRAVRFVLGAMLIVHAVWFPGSQLLELLVGLVLLGVMTYEELRDWFPGVRQTSDPDRGPPGTGR